LLYATANMQRYVVLFFALCFAVGLYGYPISLFGENPVALLKVAGELPGFGWLPLEPAPPSAKLNFFLALKQRNLDLLEQKFWAVSDPDSPDYQNFMTMEEINDLVAPSQKDVDEVVETIEALGVVNINRFGSSIEVITDVFTATKLFQTQFYVWEHEKTSRRIVRQIGKFYLPTNLVDIVDAVVGLNDFPGEKLILHKGDPEDDVVVPQTIYEMYGVPEKPNATSGSQGVIEWEDQYYSPKDQKKFGELMNLKDFEVIPDKQIVGDNDPSEPGDESTLDIQYIAATGVNVTNWFWIDSAPWLYGWSEHFLNTTSKPLVISISYGWNEEQQCTDGIDKQTCDQLKVNSKQYVELVNTNIQKMGLQGVSVLASSGDSGANGRTDEDCTDRKFHPAYPAACPYLTSVGATQVGSPKTNLQNPPSVCTTGDYKGLCISSGVEQAVSYDVSFFASGGGFSNVAATPSYQKDAVANYLATSTKLPAQHYFNKTSRGYPDVAAFGNNVLIYDDVLEPAGGTSCSSPIFAGVAALLNSAMIKKTGKPLGFLNPLLYKMASDDPTTFHDVVTGDNRCTEDGCSSSCQGFYCQAGWDPVTGLGTPNYTQMLSYITNM